MNDSEPRASAMETLAGDAPPTEASDSTTGGGPARRPSDGALHRGNRLGRYIVLDTLGRGGMGVVVAAYDPELDRKVAIKLVHAFGSSRPTAHQRLQREAQAIARLSHPNVVHVHDVGVVEGQLFIAMELVVGVDLRRWLERADHGREQILGCLLQAGEGLAAAHAAGLVHRDFKPDNVLVGDDGRVRVVDFGLARSDHGTDSLDERERRTLSTSGARSSIDSLAPLTATGALMGTPAYMAPEQFSGEAGDARSDQYSFCVTLYEALCGTRPFEGETLAELAHAVLHDDPAPPPASVMPGALWRVIARGLDGDPLHRYPDMPTLLRALRRAVAPRRARWWALAAGLLAGAGAVLAGTRSPADECETLARRGPALWSAERRAAIEARFLAVDRPYAADTWSRVTATMDQHLGRWAEVQRQVCQAELETALETQQDCLDARLREANILLDLFEEAEAPMVLRATSMAAALTDPRTCSDDERHRGRLVPADDSLRKRVEAVRAELARVHWLLMAARANEATEVLAAAALDAESLDYLPLSAEITWRRSEISSTRNVGTEESIELANTAFEQALASRHDWIAFEATIDLAYYHGVHRRDRVEGERWARRAEALLQRAGDEDQAWFQLHDTWAAIHARTGDHEEAKARYDELLARARASAPQRVLRTLLNNAGGTNIKLGNIEEGIEMLRQSMEMAEALHGADHPDALRSRANIGMALVIDGQTEEGRQWLEETYPRQEAALGADHVEVSNTLQALAIAYDNLGEPALAAEPLHRVLRIRETLYGADAVPTLQARMLMVDHLIQAGRHEEAHADALALSERLSRLTAPPVQIRAHTLQTIIDCELELGRHEDVPAKIEQLERMCASARACDERVTQWIPIFRGEARLARGEHEAAIAALHEALRDTELHHLPRARARLALASALWHDSSRHDEALDLVAQARASATEAAAGEAASIRERVDRWQTEHP